MKRKTILDRLNTWPPFLLRAMARTRGRSTTIKELAKHMGFCEAKTWRLAQLDSWRTVTLGTALNWAEACGVKLDDPQQARLMLARLGRSGFRHLRGPERRRFVARMEKLDRSHPAHPSNR